MRIIAVLHHAGHALPAAGSPSAEQHCSSRATIAAWLGVWYKLDASRPWRSILGTGSNSQQGDAQAPSMCSTQHIRRVSTGHPDRNSVEATGAHQMLLSQHERLEAAGQPCTEGHALPQGCHPCRCSLQSVTLNPGCIWSPGCGGDGARPVGMLLRQSSAWWRLHGIIPFWHLATIPWLGFSARLKAELHIPAVQRLVAVPWGRCLQPSHTLRSCGLAVQARSDVP